MVMFIADLVNKSKSLSFCESGMTPTPFFPRSLKNISGTAGLVELRA
jgi:hypothetical protein